ncbi:uncharacterized protein LY89DRAFT_100766 [Mollisia scopiformis]|uniref:F-box domain-containing protein n=1 Tax=Mollisia scopiformis TaxID=149040 RepID=A0A194X7C4_MOLSC|nr:uncharacterized protein LY89DRAFT_100766 [Mollisia scopiformis]KUJ15984.1 hypothetical protein LY89DRAFT_100766 [Mollisia scopiformis]
MMTNFSCYLENRLPPELLIPILTHLPDLESLDSFLRASPAAYRVFDTQSMQIFTTVLSSGSTHTYTCALIRIIALIRANALPSTVHDLITLKDLIRHETSPHRWTPPRWVHPPTSLPLDLPTAIIRELLAVNRNIQRLTFGCLEYYLDRFTPLKPFNSAAFSFDSTRFSDDGIGPWDDKAADTIYYYPVHDVGPPSWLEQQRVLRAFWRIQLSHDLNVALEAARIVLTDGWEGLNAQRTSPAELCDVPIQLGYHPTEDCEISELLLDTRSINDSETILEQELLESATQYRQDAADLIAESKYWRFKKDWAICSTLTDQQWEILDNTHRSDMWYFFQLLAGSCQVHDYYFRSPLQHAKFELWRPFGFAIWSTSRMAGYGLLMPTSWYAAGVGKPFYEAWRNLLTQEQLDAVEEESKRKEEELSGPRPPGILY